MKTKPTKTNFMAIPSVHGYGMKEESKSYARIPPEPAIYATPPSTDETISFPFPLSVDRTNLIHIVGGAFVHLLVRMMGKGGISHQNQNHEENESSDAVYTSPHLLLSFQMGSLFNLSHR